LETRKEGAREGGKRLQYVSGCGNEHALLRKTLISFSACNSKINNQLFWQKAMRFKQDIPTYTSSIYLRTKSSEREK
jgi:hypothetical protein